MSEQGPDVIDINDVITDDYQDLLDTGYFSTEIINSPYFKFSNLLKKEKHVYWYHGTCSLFVLCFTGIINMAWELQQRKSAETTSSGTSSGRSKSHFGVQKSPMSSDDVSKRTTLEDKAKHGKCKTSTDATEGSSKSRTHRKKLL